MEFQQIVWCEKPRVDCFFRLFNITYRRVTAGRQADGRMELPHSVQTLHLAPDR